MERMFHSIPCSICNEIGHVASRCNELISCKPPAPQRGSDTDEDHLRNVTISGKFTAHDSNHTRGSSAGHWNPLCVISI